MTSAEYVAQSALLLDHEVTEIHADGSSQSVATSVQVALTDEGRDALTHQDLSRAGSIKLLRAYSISDKGGWMINPMAGSSTATAIPDEQMKTMKGQIF